MKMVINIRNLLAGFMALTVLSTAHAQIATNIYGGLAVNGSGAGLYAYAKMTNGVSTSYWLTAPTLATSCMATNVSNITNHSFAMVVERKSDLTTWTATNAAVYFPASSADKYSITLYDQTAPGVPTGTLLKTKAVWY